MTSHRVNSGDEVSSGSGDATLADKGKAEVSSPAPASSASAAHVWFCILYETPSSCGLIASYFFRYYFIVSLSLTFLNKEVLNGFKAPLFMTLFQFIIALLLLKAIGIGGTCVHLS
jgi:hypothetical protein